MAIANGTRTLDYISKMAAARLLGLGDTRIIDRLAQEGMIRVRTIPGMKPRYNRADLERLAVESVQGHAAPA